MKPINSERLDALRVGFSKLYQDAFKGVPTDFEKIATIVPATQTEQRYGWIGQLPSVREWIGPRVIQNISSSDYSIKEKPLELSVNVPRPDVETDNLGIYSMMFKDIGRACAEYWPIMVYQQLLAGFSANCYDGQSFFDTDHPVLDVNGATVTVANTDGGSGTPWFLLDASRAVKPIILQRRKDFQFVAKDKPTDDNVFDRNMFVYGADAAGNTGFGFWQTAWGSKQTLNAANYGAARAAMSGFKGDGGRPLGIVPNLLVVPPALESTARKLLNSEYGSGGETNEWKGTAELLVSPWLA